MVDIQTCRAQSISVYELTIKPILLVGKTSYIFIGNMSASALFSRLMLLIKLKTVLHLKNKCKGNVCDSVIQLCMMVKIFFFKKVM